MLFDSLSLSLSLSLSRFLSFITLGNSSRGYPMSAYTWCMKFLTSGPTNVSPGVWFNKSTSLIGSSLLLQHVFFVLLDGSWDGRQVAVHLLFCGVLLPEFVQNSTKHSCLFSSSFFSFIHFVWVHMVHPYPCTDTLISLKKPRFVLLKRLNIKIFSNLLITSYAFLTHMLTSLSVANPYFLAWNKKTEGIAF